jgi:hypothetical protein
MIPKSHNYLAPSIISEKKREIIFKNIKQIILAAYIWDG